MQHLSLLFGVQTPETATRQLQRSNSFRLSQQQQQQQQKRLLLLLLLPLLLLFVADFLLYRHASNTKCENVSLNLHTFSVSNYKQIKLQVQRRNIFVLIYFLRFSAFLLYARRCIDEGSAAFSFLILCIFAFNLA